ncbi:68055e27-405c-4d66-9d60-9eb5954ca1d0 [Sclerotinia trifoliorum]|uniref:68055e27-405c-4d66-9d60-9eb5954ca1d0 n=1 Tax=Sclerotinia trifoliorum TaxID=28548 RepID=A0A8H2VPN9_9HELO|nr:68055e27-405c-4d66-9d60-9eb5954ca1d0 [Sclerotinia trifoliorum]
MLQLKIILHIHGFPHGWQMCVRHNHGFPAPQSRGDVSIKPKGPTENPTINHNYLGNPLDMLMFGEGCQHGNEAGTKNIVIGSWPRYNNHYNFTTREGWVSVIRSSADTCYYPNGTCKMAKVDDPMVAILDEKVNVRGICGPQVAD